MIGAPFEHVSFHGKCSKCILENLLKPVNFVFSLVRGFGELDSSGTGETNEQGDEGINMEDMTAPDPTSLPFLLLDIRDSDAYNECHIIGGKFPSFQVSFMSRLKDGFYVPLH